MTGVETEGPTPSQAALLHKAGKVAEAITMCEALLERRPQDVELLTLLGMSQLKLGRVEEAHNTWRRCLAVAAPAEAKLRTIAKMMWVAREGGRTLDFMADLVIPDWPQGSIPDPDDSHMIIALARRLLSHKRADAASRLIESVLPNLTPDTDFVKAAKAIIFTAGDASKFGNELPSLLADAVFVRYAAAVLLENGDADKALAILEPLTSRPESVDRGLIVAHAVAAHLAGHRKEARDLARRVVETTPIHLTTKEPGQLMLIGVLNQAPSSIKSIVTPTELHFYKNTAASLARHHNDQFRFVSIFPEARSALPALAGAPQPRLILNNWVNGETLSTPRTLQFVADFADRLGLPVLNHPRKAVETTRLRNAERLAGIPNLLVPRLIGFLNKSDMREQLARHIGKTVGFPVIIRDPFAQRGILAEKIGSLAELSRHLATRREMPLYAIQYVDNPAAQGAYRKIRAAVIGDELFITHVHFGPRWNVHRERDREKLTAFDLDGKVTAHAARIIAAPEETLGRPAMAALHEIRRRISLELYGIDFDILPDGRVLFFEANAAMNLSLADRAGLENTRAAMRAAVRKLILEAAGRKAH